MTRAEFRELRKQEEDRVFWVIALQVPLDDMPFIYAQMEKAVGKITLSHPTDADPMRPALVNARFDLVPEARSNMKDVLCIEMPRGDIHSRLNWRQLTRSSAGPASSSSIQNKIVGGTEGREWAEWDHRRGSIAVPSRSNNHPHQGIMDRLVRGVEPKHRKELQVTLVSCEVIRPSRRKPREEEVYNRGSWGSASRAAWVGWSKASDRPKARDLLARDKEAFKEEVFNRDKPGGDSQE
ncbi:hypothetical protein CBR_g29545 [Chara braunii]|uniref:Uncharacterized protein n=1 Tax=Chara braunii TaxID=69332 RepID=A0A388LAT4_CHABU|nr:hypothetical protein CBR_g29545 [Chara braunii]|eukprot:GBG79396.1 hypothetical protein CBR_g29545 [Chara braunii]